MSTVDAYKQLSNNINITSGFVNGPAESKHRGCTFVLTLKSEKHHRRGGD